MQYINKIVLVAIVTAKSLTLQAQNSSDIQTKTDTQKDKSYTIEEVIKLKDSLKVQQKMLIEFKNKWQLNDHISVIEFQNYFEITVLHSGVNNYTGWAECYTLDKSTGEQKMIWHERPSKLPDLEQDIKKRDKNDK